jgi:preprotein translocase subunit SecA
MVTRGIARAQKKVEARNFDIRKHLLEYDEVMDKQRKFLYAQRQEALEWKALREKTVGMFEEVFEPVLETHAGNKDEPVAWEELRNWLQHKSGGALELDGIEQVGREQLFDWVIERVEKLCAARQQTYGEKEWDGVQRFLLIDTMDHKWKDHLHAMEVLKAGIGLRSYAQVDPKNEYKKEGFEKFQQLKAGIADHVTSFVFKREATDTIRDLITGRLRQPAPPPPMPVPRTPQEAQALLESLIAAGQVPKEIVERMQKGERFVLSSTPRGLVLQPAAPPPADGQGGQAPAPAGGGPRPAGPVGAAPRPGGQQPATPGAAAAVGSRRPAPARPANTPKPGRNDPCPCGSGIKYKKCCAPAFD